MNTIKELIEKYCPDGVEYKKLGEVCTFQRGTSLTSKNAIEGDIPVISGGQKPAFYHNVANREANSITVAGSGAYAGYVSFWNKPIFAADCFTVNPDCSILLIKYVYHYLLNIQEKIYGTKKGAGVPHVHGNDIAKFLIPVPPLPVQHEIVRILDNFTSLEAELEAELEARRKQYEYYRDQLLSFKHLSGEGKNDVEWKTLGEMGTFIRGNGLQKKDFTDNGFPCIHYGQIHTTYNTFTDKTVSYTSFEKAKHLKKAHKGDLLIATTSEDVDACCKAVAWLGESQCAISGDSYIYHHNQDPKYIAYLFQTDMFAKQKKTAATGTKVIRVSGDAMAKFKFPLPPLSTQRRIVSILDRFESLVNDITTGLPAEIAARHQQYEYYRDQLLSFKRKS